MPETDTIPVSASVASTGKGIRYIGGWAYAYSKLTTVADTNTHTLLDFTSGSGIIVAQATFYRRSWEDNDIAWFITMNGEEMLSWIGRVAENQGQNFFPIIIPPFTHLIGYVDKQEQTATSKVGMNITGRVYGAV